MNAKQAIAILCAHARNVGQFGQGEKFHQIADLIESLSAKAALGDAALRAAERDYDTICPPHIPVGDGCIGCPWMDFCRLRAGGGQEYDS